MRELECIQSRENDDTPATKEHEDNRIENIPEIIVRDPKVIKAKGRPRKKVCIQFSLDDSQNQTRKRACSLCGEKGHYISTCSMNHKDDIVSEILKSEHTCLLFFFNDTVPFLFSTLIIKTNNLRGHFWVLIWIYCHLTWVCFITVISFKVSSICRH